MQLSEQAAGVELQHDGANHAAGIGVDDLTVQAGGLLAAGQGHEGIRRVAHLPGLPLQRGVVALQGADNGVSAGQQDADVGDLARHLLQLPQQIPAGALQLLAEQRGAGGQGQPLQKSVLIGHLVEAGLQQQLFGPDLPGHVAGGFVQPHADLIVHDVRRYHVAQGAQGHDRDDGDRQIQNQQLLPQLPFGKPGLKGADHSLLPRNWAGVMPQ